MSSDPAPFEVEREAATLRGEAAGEGHPIGLLHGLTATRRYVVHGSRTLERSGFRTLAYDARGHGESDPAPAGSGYGFGELAADLGSVLEAQADGRPYVLAGHSMGAHTLVAHALAAPERAAALIVIGPAYLGGCLLYTSDAADE